MDITSDEVAIVTNPLEKREGQFGAIFCNIGSITADSVAYYMNGRLWAANPHFWGINRGCVCLNSIYRSGWVATLHLCCDGVSIYLICRFARSLT